PRSLGVSQKPHIPNGSPPKPVLSSVPSLRVSQRPRRWMSLSRLAKIDDFGAPKADLRRSPDFAFRHKERPHLRARGAPIPLPKKDLGAVGEEGGLGAGGVAVKAVAGAVLR